MSTIKAFAARHPVSTYFALTFSISWGGALVAIGGSGAMRGTTPGSDPRFAAALIAMLAGPSIAGILMTWLVHGGPGVSELFSRMRKWRVDRAWYAVALLTAPIAMLATLAALSVFSPAFVPGVFVSPDKASLLLVSLAVGLSAGVFEEIGWTGFAIPTLMRRHTPLATGFIVGVFWSAWHWLPNVWSARAAAGELAVPLYLTAMTLGAFVGYLTAFRVLMVWVYEHTASVFVGMVMHVSITTSLLILNPLNFAGTNLQLYSFGFAGALWILWALVAFTDRRRVRHHTSAKEHLEHSRLVRPARRSVHADRVERTRFLPGDSLIREPLASLTHAITIARSPHAVWPWLVQMGAGTRGGWYSYDTLDNARQPSATRLVPELQQITIGTVFPALPGVTEGFNVLAFQPNRSLVLGWPAPDGKPLVTWSFFLERRADDVTRLIVRVRGAEAYRFHGLPRWLSKLAARFVHYLMQRRQMLGIAARVENADITTPLERETERRARMNSNAGKEASNAGRRIHAGV